MRQIVASSLLLAVFGLSACGESEPIANDFDHIEPDVLAVMRAQEALRPAIDRLHREIETGQHPGAMTVAYSDDSTGVELWWKGDLPAGMRTAIAEAEQIAPVTVHPAAYSRAELSEQARVIGDTMRAHPELGLQSVSLLGDGSGLRVGVRAAAGDQEAGRIGKPAFARDLPAVSVPVTTVLEAPFAPAAATRQNDEPPYNSGGRIRTSPEGGCTSGWGVKKRGTSTTYLMTAGHCGAPGRRYTDGAGDFLGTGSREHVYHDLLLITARAYHWMWDLGVNSSVQRAVAGWGWATPNEVVCQSGATSGFICNIKTHTDWSQEVCGWDSDGAWRCYGDLISAYKVGGGVGGRLGDSGGPVYTLSGSRVSARGTVTGVQVNGPWLYFQDFATAVRDFPDIEILTGW
jgi:streptogrisin D